MRYLDEDFARATRRSGTSSRRSPGTDPSCASVSRTSTTEWRAVLRGGVRAGAARAYDRHARRRARRARGDVQRGDHPRAALRDRDGPPRAARLDRRLAWRARDDDGDRDVDDTVSTEQTRARYPDEEGLRRARRRARLLRGLRRGRADGALHARLVARSTPALEDADPVPRAPLPGGHVRPARQRTLGPPVRGRARTSSRSSRADALAVLDATGTEQAVRRERCRSRRGSGRCCSAADHPERVSGIVFIAPALPHARRATHYRERACVRRAARRPTRAGRSSTATTGCATTPASSSSSSRSVCTEPHSTKQSEDVGRLGARDRRRDAGRCVDWTAS